MNSCGAKECAYKTARLKTKNNKNYEMVREQNKLKTKEINTKKEKIRKEISNLNRYHKELDQGYKIGMSVDNPTDVNREYWTINFIENNLFDKEQCINYHKCSASYIDKTKKFFSILIPNKPTKDTIEQRINKEFNNIFTINDRIFIKPLEIDLINEENKFGIEYNGLIWHSLGKSEHSKFNNLNEREFKNKHINKTNLAEGKGIQLFHIFENEC